MIESQQEDEHQESYPLQ